MTVARAAASVAGMTQPGTHALDPRGLICEAFRIEGIAAEDCRSIFFDWAMGLAQGIDPGDAAAVLAAAYGAPADHPMTRLLAEAQTQARTGPRPSRRRRARAAGTSAGGGGDGPLGTLN
ncbi:MAG: hypothetical protein AAFV86_10055 [Pseudomonadota bacterium]